MRENEVWKVGQGERRTRAISTIKFCRVWGNKLYRGVFAYNSSASYGIDKRCKSFSKDDSPRVYGPSDANHGPKLLLLLQNLFSSHICI